MKGIGISKCGNGHMYIVKSWTGFKVAVYRDRRFYGIIKGIHRQDTLHGEAWIGDKDGTCTPLKDLGLYSAGDGYLKSRVLEQHAIMALNSKENRYAKEASALYKFHGLEGDGNAKNSKG